MLVMASWHRKPPSVAEGAATQHRRDELAKQV